MSATSPRIAALYDIHGNLPALEAVLEDVRREGVERIVVGGDVVPGPFVRQVLDLLLSCGIPLVPIRGNSESAVLAMMRGQDPGPLPQAALEVTAAAAKEIPEYEEMFASWPLTETIEVAGVGRVLFCHGTPRHENEIFTRLTAEERLRDVLGGIDADILVCGHTHMQFDRIVGRVRVVNAGSVGMPFGTTGADWLIIGPEIGLRHTDYDLAVAARRIRETTYPQADDFAERNVLHVPPEDVMLEVLGKAELRYAHLAAGFIVQDGP
jgi:putative phosphoesterase